MSCSHYWQCEENRGEYSRAVCRDCGEVKSFSNWEPDFGGSRKAGWPNSDKRSWGQQSLRKRRTDVVADKSGSGL